MAKTERTLLDELKPVLYDALEHCLLKDLTDIVFSYVTFMEIAVYSDGPIVWFGPLTSGACSDIARIRLDLSIAFDATKKGLSYYSLYKVTFEPGEYHLSVTGPSLCDIVQVIDDDGRDVLIPLIKHELKPHVLWELGFIRHVQNKRICR